MRSRLVPLAVAGLWGALAAASAALAQPDPAAGRQRGSRLAAAQPQAATSEAVAGQFAISYLGFWSLPNILTMPAMPDFYEPRVVFHGRPVTARQLFDEKLRFVRRWPERRYTARPGTMQASCRADVCAVRTAFDFTASNPRVGRRSRGTGILDLRVRLVGNRFVIFRETSRVVRRG